MKKVIFFAAAWMTLSSAGLFAQRTDLSDLKFCIDPGHGGHSSNDRPPVFADVPYWESDGNFEKALFLKEMLENRGAVVVLTRYTNDYPNDADEPSLAARVETANSNDVDWFHSIHSNATGVTNTSINYTLILVREKRSLTDRYASTGNGLGVPELPESWDMADIMRQKIFQNDRTKSNMRYLDWTFYGGTNGGFSLGVLRGLAMPGELSEGSFHDLQAEARRLMNSRYRKMEAYAIYSSFLQYYSVPSDNFGIVAGILTDSVTGSPRNGIRVRVMPENIIYTGDNYNNGYYMIDSLAPGLHTVRFEKLNYTIDSAQVTVAAGGVYFNDRTLNFNRFPIVVSTSPLAADTSILVSRSLIIQFSAAMDTASVRTAFSITPSIAGSLVWSNGNKTLTFVPSQNLFFSTLYTVQLNSSVRSLSGYGLDQNDDGVGGDVYSFAFKTEQALLAMKTPVVFPQAALGDSTVVQIGIRNRAEISNTLLAIYTKTALFRCFPSLPLPIAAGDSIFITVAFLPQTYGSSFVDTLFVNTLNGSLKIPLSGASPAPSLYVNTKSMAFVVFGPIPIGDSRTVPFYITSLSANPVRVDSITLRTNNFQMSSFDVPKVMKLGDTLRIDLTFAPTIAGSLTDSVTIYNNSSVPIYRIALSGNGAATSVDEQGSELLPKTVALFQNYPNPFNPTTVISYQVPITSLVKLAVYDLMGREVAILVNGERPAGRYSITWDARGLSSGLYFYRFESHQITGGQAGSYIATKKLILLK